MSNARYISSLTHPRIVGFEWQDSEDDRDRKMFRDILEHGCEIIGIEPDHLVPDYSFSVGLYLNFLHPEILIMGVSMNACAHTINRLCEEAADGKMLQSGDTRSDLFDVPRPVRFVPVPQERYFDYLGTAVWFYRSLLWKVPPVAEHKFPVLQAVWPDPEGFYPDDTRCRPEVRKVQTLVEQPDPS
jgi:Domain of unknown function (DUF4262)